MKILFLILLTLFWSLNAFSTEIKDVEMFGYARAGVGTNTFGGDQECFYNQGAGGWNGNGRNEFRLGNECSNYLEIATKFNHIKTDTKKVYTQFRIANSDTRRDADASTYFAEAFAEIQNLNYLPWSFWVGKRFYRDQDVYMDDNYYFGNMSGNGGGIGNIDFIGSKLSVAYLRQVKDTNTNIGKVGTTVLDVRLKEFKLTQNLKENFWFAYGQVPAGTNSKTQYTCYNFWQRPHEYFQPLWYR
jgi:maltoporin